MQRNSVGQKRNQTYESSLENPSLKGFASGMAKNTAKAFGDIGSGIGKGMLDIFTGTQYSPEQSEKQQNHNEKPGNFQKKAEFKRLYDFNAEQEKRTMKELMKKIDQEIEAIKRANSALAAEVKDIEKLTITSANEKPGIYHIRFLELMLSFLQSLRSKISESSTWLQAMQSKKKKRGSLFASLSKKRGTQYSMSEEIKMTRSVQ
jgi:hypothetical protein